MPLTWADLAGIVTRPPQAQYADFSGLPDTVAKMRQLDQHDAQLAQQEQQAQAAIAQRAAQAQAAEAGRRERAIMRGQQATDKLSLERDKMAQAQGLREQEQFVKMRAEFEDAVRRGDPVAIDIAKQHLQGIGVTVSGGASGSTSLSHGALTGSIPSSVPAPQARAFAGPPATAGIAKPPVDIGALDAAAKSQGQAINQGLPQPPAQTSPSPVNDQINAAKQRSLPGGPPQAPTPQPAATKPAPGPQSPPGPPTPDPYVLRKGNTELLRLGAPGVDQDAASNYFKGLLDEARSPEEKRAARIAQHTAQLVTQKEGIDKGREAGDRRYQFELNRLRKGGVGGGTGGGSAPNFGGTGMSKQELAVDEKDAAEYHKQHTELSQRYKLPELGTLDHSLAAVEAAGREKNGTAQLAAVTKALRGMGNVGAMSDKDLDRIMNSSGVWNNLKNIINRAASGELPPELVTQTVEMAKQQRAAIREHRKAAAAEFEGILNEDPFIHGNRGKIAGFGRRAVSGEVGDGQSKSTGSGQGVLFQRLGLTGE